MGATSIAAPKRSSEHKSHGFIFTPFRENSKNKVKQGEAPKIRGWKTTLDQWLELMLGSAN